MLYQTIMNTGQPPIATTIEIPQSVQNIGNQITETINNVSQSISSNINRFSQQTEAGVEASSGFLSSNTIIAKFAFLILIVILFLFLLNLGTLLIQYFRNSSSPYLIDGMIDGDKGRIVSQNPKVDDSITLLRSNNESSGIEFTWSTWIRVDELSEFDTFQHVFHKGVRIYDGSGIAQVNNAPGLYLKRTTSVDNTAETGTLRVVMTTDTADIADIEHIEVDNIPLKLWVNVIIRMQNTVLDVYINGTVAGRLNLTKVPLQNYHDVYICQNGGFTGKLSNLRYYDNALNIFQISKIVASGPNTNMDTSNKEMQDYGYLAGGWYFNKL